jgi:hypothetical protein
MQITNQNSIMKYLIIFTTVIFFLSCKTTEIPNKKVSFDFSNPVYPPVITIKPKQAIEITLQNVNPYLYEISIKDSLIVHQIEQPTLFGQIFKLLELNTTPTEAPASNPKVAGALPRDNTPAKIAKEDENILAAELKTFVSKYSGEELAITDVLIHSKIAVDLEKLLQDCYSTLPQLKTLADNYIQDKLTMAAGTIPIGIQTEIERISTSARRNMEQYIATGEELKKKHQAILDQASSNMTLTEYRSIEKDIKEKIFAIDKILDNSKKLLAKLTEFDEAKVGTTIEENYKKVMTSRIEKSIVVPTLYRTDEANINIEVKKKKEIYCSKEISKIPLSAVVKGGVKIDFSTGLVLNIGNNSFFDQKYYYDSVYRNDKSIADSVTIKRNRNNNQVIPSIGAFFHVYSRFLSPINIGGMVGASLGSDQRAYFHLGSCLLIGKSDRLIIGGGISIANGETLDGKYEENQIIKRGLAPTSIPNETATRIGGYVSVSWNLNLIK